MKWKRGVKYSRIKWLKIKMFCIRGEKVSLNRINDFIIVDQKEISSLFTAFDRTLTILDFSLMKDSMRNTGYMVTTTTGKYFLKLYSNTTDKIETAAYIYLKDKINVPELYYYDSSRQRFPFAYTITEFLDGVTFMHHIRSNLKYPVELACEVGRMCAVIHQRRYAYDALLDERLNISQKLPCTREKILHLIDGKPAEYLKSETIKKLCGFIKENPALFDRIEAESALCHGDFGYGNIMIFDGKVYFVDFEFAYSGSMYNDIGRFFRRKGDAVQALINRCVYDAFAQGYNSASPTPLPSNWLALAHLCDINAMLCLLNYDNVPAKWVEDIEYDILYAIKENIQIDCVK